MLRLVNYQAESLVTFRVHLMQGFRLVNYQAGSPVTFRVHLMQGSALFDTLVLGNSIKILMEDMKTIQVVQSMWLGTP